MPSALTITIIGFCVGMTAGANIQSRPLSTNPKNLLNSGIKIYPEKADFWKNYNCGYVPNQKIVLTNTYRPDKPKSYKAASITLGTAKYANGKSTWVKRTQNGYIFDQAINILSGQLENMYPKKSKANQMKHAQLINSWSKNDKLVQLDFKIMAPFEKMQTIHMTTQKHLIKQPVKTPKSQTIYLK